MRQGSRMTPVLIEEMKSEKTMIKKVHKVFRPKYASMAKKKKGLVNNNDIDKLMNKAIQSVPMKQEQEEIVQGFYDTYMMMLFIGGSDEAEKFAKRIFE